MMKINIEEQLSHFGFQVRSFAARIVDGVIQREGRANFAHNTALALIAGSARDLLSYRSLADERRAAEQTPGNVTCSYTSGLFHRHNVTASGPAAHTEQIAREVANRATEGNPHVVNGRRTEVTTDDVTCRVNTTTQRLRPPTTSP